ncbi:hypothetical protein GEMRC1_010659 [Eukaryota sp. GEM-RC1]
MAFRSFEAFSMSLWSFKGFKFHHLIKCHQFIHFGSIIHINIRCTCLDMFKANGFYGKIEPLLANLSDQPKVDRSRGDLIGPWLSCQEIFMDFTTVDPCNSRSISKIFDDDFSALEVAAKAKFAKNSHLINQLNVDRYHSMCFNLLRCRYRVILDQLHNVF